MARRNYLVEGLSGAGKSSVYEELIRRGYGAISTDRAWKVNAGSRLEDALWDPGKALSELESTDADVVFVCGSSRNRDRFLPYFTKVFNLRIDDETMRRRLHERTNNDFGKQPEELERMLTLNRGDERPPGAIDVDATRPLDLVVADVLRLAACPPAITEAERAPWSRRGPRTARSFVIPEAALPAFWDGGGSEILVRLDYSWSGDVLATLLAYLAEHEIDLLHPEHGAAASTPAESTLVLTSHHQERHLALLDPIEFDGAALRRHYEQSTGTAAAGVEYAMLDGIAFLRDTLAPLEPGTVAVVVIGSA